MSCLAAAGVVWMSALALKCLSAGLLDLWRSPLFRVFFLLQPGLLCLRSFFFNQSSFFGLVRPGGESVREVRDGDVVRGPLQELALGRLALGGGPGPGWELTGAAAFLLRSSATRSSLITILLLQPVFFLRPWARRKLKTGT